MKKSLKKCFALAAAAALAVSAFAGCGVKVTKPDETKAAAGGSDTKADATADGEIVKATEGSLTIYTAFEDDQIDKYLASFKEKYPDIKLDVIRESTGTLIAKVIAEKDNPVADVIWGTSASVMLQLEPYGLIKGYKPETAEELDPKFYDSSGMRKSRSSGTHII